MKTSDEYIEDMWSYFNDAWHPHSREEKERLRDVAMLSALLAIHTELKELREAVKENTVMRGIG